MNSSFNLMDVHGSTWNVRPKNSCSRIHGFAWFLAWFYKLYAFHHLTYVSQPMKEKNRWPIWTDESWPTLWRIYIKTVKHVSRWLNRALFVTNDFLHCSRVPQPRNRELCLLLKDDDRRLSNQLNWKEREQNKNKSGESSIRMTWRNLLLSQP